MLVVVMKILSKLDFSSSFSLKFVSLRWNSLDDAQLEGCAEKVRIGKGHRHFSLTGAQTLLGFRENTTG